MPEFLLDGFLNLAKPSGCTSRAVVDRVKRLVKPAKTGHAGTLDPLAEGVLVVAVGQATRLIDEVQASQKRYRGEFRLGCTSDTEDVEGEVVSLEDPPIPYEQQLAAACKAQLGAIQQVPPRFSALKVNGARAYRLARKGVDVEMKPRTVQIDRCDLVEFDYPRFVLEIDCGAGTYVRSVGRDIGAAVGGGAIMTALTRTAVGGFLLENALPVEALDADSLAQSLLPMQAALPDTPQLILKPDESVALQNGLFIANRFELREGEVAAGLGENNRLMSLLTLASDGRVRPQRNFPLRQSGERSGTHAKTPSHQEQQED